MEIVRESLTSDKRSSTTFTNDSRQDSSRFCWFVKRRTVKVFKTAKQQHLLNELYNLSDKFVLKSEADCCIRVVALLFAILQEFPDDIYRM